MATRKHASLKVARKKGTASKKRRKLLFKRTISEREICEIFGPRNPLVKRLFNAEAKGGAWLDVVGDAAPGGDDGRLIDYRSFRRAYKRLMKGERPPILAGEHANPEIFKGKKGPPKAAGAELLRVMRRLPRLGQSIYIPAGAKSFVVSWPDGTQEIYKAIGGNKRGGKKRLVLSTYRKATLSSLDVIWSAERLPGEGF